jgi:hypothetical protein
VTTRAARGQFPGRRRPPAATLELTSPHIVGKQSLMRQHRRMSWDAGYCFGSLAFRYRSFC